MPRVCGLFFEFSWLPFDRYRTDQRPDECSQRIMDHIVNLGLSQRKVILAEFNPSAYQSKEHSDKDDSFCLAPALGQ